MNHKKSFWGGVITGVLAAALIVSGVFFRAVRMEFISVIQNAGNRGTE